MKCILVVDDERQVREATAILLRAHGYEVVTAETGLAGIELIATRPVDLAIIDLFMPGMDGLKATETIRRRQPTLPIITVSGFMLRGECPPMPYFGEMAASAGAFTALYKPLRPKELLQAVQDALSAATESV